MLGALARHEREIDRAGVPALSAGFQASAAVRQHLEQLGYLEQESGDETVFRIAEDERMEYYAPTLREGWLVVGERRLEWSTLEVPRPGAVFPDRVHQLRAVGSEEGVDLAAAELDEFARLFRIKRALERALFAREALCASEPRQYVGPQFDDP